MKLYLIENQKKILVTVSFKIFEVNNTCTMIASYISHCSYFIPAGTIPVLQYLSYVFFTIIPSIITAPCNMGQCEGGEAILSLLIGCSLYGKSALNFKHIKSCALFIVRRLNMVESVVLHIENLTPR